MSGIPWTTTIEVLRGTAADGTEVSDRLLSSYSAEIGDVTVLDRPARVIAVLKAHIGNPSGTERILTGDQEVVAFKLTCEPYDLLTTDQVRDRSNGVVYDVVWAAMRNEIKGLQHTQGALSRSRGVSA